MVQLSVDWEVDEVFSTTKTEQTAQKQGKKVRAVTYHAASFRAHVTPPFVVIKLKVNNASLIVKPSFWCVV